VVEVLDRQLLAEEAIRRAVVDDHVSLVWPDQLVNADLGTREEVLAALEGLVVAGKLDPVVQVVSSEGHVCWEGTPADFVKVRQHGFQCPEECSDDSPDDLDEHIVIFFRVTSRWREIVEVEKKSLQAASAWRRSPEHRNR
jgi:hypothetical protein